MPALNPHDTPLFPGKMMSLYKTMRCRYFDESGKGVKPFCNQGSRCRFIHPSDPQWDKGRNNPEKSFYGDTKSDKSKVKPKNKPKTSSTSPTPRGPRSSPLVSQYDLFKRNQGELDRERGRDHEVKAIQRDRSDRDDHWERYVRDRDRSKDVRRSSRERLDENRRPYSSKRSKKTEGQALRSSIIDSGDSRESGSRHGKDHRDALQMTQGNPSAQSSADKRKHIELVGEFSSRLAKLCSQLVQDSCQLDKEEEKLKAFTELSSELSKAAPSTAMAVTPALAAVITSHAKCKERVAARVKELDSLWENLFSILVTNIVKTTNINLEHAITSLQKERDAALQSYSRSSGPLLLKRKAHDQLWDELDRPMGSMTDGDGDKGTADDGHGSDTLPQSPDFKRRRVESSVATTVKEEGVDLKDLLETVKSSLAMHSRALDLLAKEKQLDASPESDYCVASITSARRDPSPERTSTMDVEASPLAKALCP